MEPGEPKERSFIVIVMGVAGTGKSTLGQALAGAFGWPWVDGDDLHPQANVEKMSRGEPLDDGDRIPWLQAVRATGVRALRGGRLGRPGGMLDLQGARGAVLACSALKKSYREILRGRASSGGQEKEVVDDGVETFFVWIKGQRATMLERIEQRQGHFMKATMLDSQLAALEIPIDEDDIVTVPLALPRNDQLKVALDGLKLLIERP